MKKTITKIAAFFLSATIIITGFTNLSFANRVISAAEAEIPEGFIPIYTPEEFNDIRNNLDGNYILMNDITFQAEDFQEGGAYYNNGIGWMPIGSETTPFTGNLNGNYHMVKGIIIQQSSSMNNDATFYGLFGCVENGTIENLSIIDSLIEVNTATSHIGSLAGGIKNSTIKNCYNTGAINLVSTTTAAVGGIIGYSEKSSINNCKNAGSVIITVKGDSLYSGGIVGYDFGSEITYCCNMGTITEILSPRHIIPAAPIYIAGILGQSFMSNINNCYNNGEIIVKDTVEDMMGYLINAGGISNAGSISYCYNTGNLMIFSRLLSYTGGIAGQAISINNCYNIGQITSNTTDSASSIGGIAGYVSSTLENCYNTGIVAAEASDSYIGGIAGKINESTSVNNNYYLNIIANGIGNGEYTAVSCAIEEMQKSETFVGFNFDSVWTINTCQGYLYPQLQTNRQAPDGHNFSDWQERTPATCTEKGEEYRTCACGEEETREITALGHSFTNYVADNNATCTENGTETAKCDRCDATDTRTIENSALGHDYSEEWTIDKEATCTQPGSKSHHCTRCRDKADITEIPAAGHSFGEWFVEKPASMTEDGLEVRICSVCKEREEKILPAGEYLPGDVDNNGKVDDKDATYLLMYIFYPEDYPVRQDCDFNHDGEITDEDASYLLYYTFFPDDYPLIKQ